MVLFYIGEWYNIFMIDRMSYLAIAVSLALFLPSRVFAAAPPIPPAAKTFVGKISTLILNPLIALLFGIATLYFIYGVLQYIWNPDNEEARTTGKQSMIWGIVGMCVMVSVFGIMRLLINSIGADPTLMNYV